MRITLLLTVAVAALAACSGDALAPSGTCAGAVPFSISGGSATAAIGTDDCKDGAGNVGDLYQLTLPSAGAFQLNVASTGFDASLAVYVGSPTSAAPVPVGARGPSASLAVNYYLPAGTYYAVVTSVNGKSGTYRLTSSAASTDGCTDNITMPGVDIAGVISATDCAGAPPATQDIYEMYLKQGQSVTATATVNKAAGLLFRTGGASSADLVNRFVNAAGTMTLTYTAPAAGYYRVHSIGQPSTVGSINYSLSIR